jgi:excisionase family DNA binding protein
MTATALILPFKDDIAISPQEAQELTGIPRGWYYEKARQGKIPAGVTFRAGKYRRFWKRSLMRWLADSGAQPTV